MIIKNIVANIYSYSIKIKNKFSDFKLPEMKQKLNNENSKPAIAEGKMSSLRQSRQRR